MKEKKLPNRTDIPIEIPEATIDGKFIARNMTYAKSFTFTAANINPEFMKALTYIPETTATPWYNNEEKTDSEIANLKYKAKQLLNHPYDMGRIVTEFGKSKIPRNQYVECKCGEKIVHASAFFMHMISDHGNSLESTVNLFERVLHKIQNLK